jgi:hypothetical protein
VLDERRKELRDQHQKELTRLREDHSAQLRKLRDEYSDKVNNVSIDTSVSDLLLAITRPAWKFVQFDLNKILYSLTCDVHVISLCSARENLVL